MSRILVGLVEIRLHFFVEIRLHFFEENLFSKTKNGAFGCTFNTVILNYCRVSRDGGGSLENWLLKDDIVILCYVGDSDHCPVRVGWPISWLPGCHQVTVWALGTLLWWIVTARPGV